LLNFSKHLRNVRRRIYQKNIIKTKVILAKAIVEKTVLYIYYISVQEIRLTITHKFSARGGIRTHEILRYRILSPAPLTELGNPRS
jgi:hypothetical protein